MARWIGFMQGDIDPKIKHLRRGIRKAAPFETASLQVVRVLTLCRADCFDGTYISTCAAIGAEFRIDLVNVTLTYRLNRTFIDAGAACSAIIGNYISHIFRIIEITPAKVV
jgi:hypothetical protein